MKMPKDIQDQYVLTYNKYRDDLIKYSDEFKLMEINCEHNRLVKLNENLEEISHDLDNMFEDLFGSVRVFVRIRPLISAIDDLTESKDIHFEITNNTNIMMNCKGEETFKKTEFFGCFNSKCSNLDIYTGITPSLFDINKLKVNLKIGKKFTDIKHYALIKTFKQLESGYSIVLSGYGMSGSGKTSTFIGYDNEPGLLHYGLRNLENVEKLELYQAFELYYDYVSPNDLSMHNKIIILYDKTESFSKDMEEYGADSKLDFKYELLDFKKTYVTYSEDTGNFIKNITETCLKNMKEHSRIKRTPLNDKSSRSHLFLVFRVTFSTGIIGFITLSDQAGREDVYSIYNDIFTKNNTLPYLLHNFDSSGRFKGEVKRTISQFLKTTDYDIKNGDTILLKGSEGKLYFNDTDDLKLENTLSKNIQMLYESFSICESLNHLQYFFNRRNNINKTFGNQYIEHGNLKYATNRCFKPPQLEDVFHPLYKKITNYRSTCLILPILNYLDKLNKNKNTITKFVMFISLRSDKCAENKSSLEFAESISRIGKNKKQD